jgi:hypothetical protein
VEGGVNFASFTDRLAINGDLVVQGIHACAKFANKFPVHCDSPLQDDRLAGAPGSYASVGEIFLETNHEEKGAAQRRQNRAALLSKTGLNYG